MESMTRAALLCLVGVASVLGCGASSSKFGSSGGSSSGANNGSGIFVGSGAQGGFFIGGSGSGARADGGTVIGALTIMPIAPVLTIVAGQPVPTVQFSAYLQGTQTPAAWTLDRGELGTLSATGLFTPTGTVAGTGNVTAVVGGATGATTVTVNIQTTQQGDPAWMANLPPPGPGGYGGVGGDGPGGGPTPAQMTTLGGTPTADAAVTLLYPYDGTVWPQGLLAPLLQWNPGAHTFDSLYLHLKGANYDYKGYFAANKTPFVNLPVPQAAWDAATLSGGTVTATLVFGEGAKAVGPYVETWTMAPATLHGTIYYNSYGTALVKNSATDGLDYYMNQYGAGTLAIAPGATSPTLAAGVTSVGAGGNGVGCRVCHTVSADGTRLVTQASNISAKDYSNTVTINLANDTTGGAGTSLQTADLAFPALLKDGSLLFSSSGGMINGDTASQLYALPAGTPVAGVTGLPADFQAALPAFSPDSQHVSFNFWGGSFPSGASMLAGDMVSLGILDFDGKLAFSNPRVLYSPASNREVTFSSFLPTSSGIVFEVELGNPSGNWGFTWQGNTGELWWVDIASAQAARLDALNGYGPGGVSALPGNAGGAATHTGAVDATLNYEPTVNPIASGGYAWVVFTSRRMYGNVAQLDPWASDPRKYPWLDQVTDKKLWVAAVDLNAAPGTDPSHPAFYLPGQELHAGNARGYWSVDVCHQDGLSCETGDECCGGYCQRVDGGLVCSSYKPVCAALYDKCAQDSDCCAASQNVHCINMVCAGSQPPK
jgi:hypothetical protein